MISRSIAFIALGASALATPASALAQSHGPMAGAAARTTAHPFAMVPAQRAPLDLMDSGAVPEQQPRQLEQKETGSYNAVLTTSDERSHAVSVSFLHPEKRNLAEPDCGVSDVPIFSD